MGGVEHFASDHAVFEEDHAVCVRGGVRIVRDHEDGLLVLSRCITQQPQNLRPRVGVEVTGRLIRKYDLRASQQSAHNGNALLLAAGELFGAVIQAVLQPQSLNKIVTPYRVGFFAGQSQWQVDVLPGGKGGYEVKGLEDEPYVFAAEFGELVVFLPVQLGAANLDACFRVSIRGVEVAKVCMSVDLPEPEGPIMAVNLPRSKSMVTLFRA